jgi:Flp pilus assembly protein TadG
MILFLFFLLDVAWMTYSRAVLQYAVAQGVRYAVTDQTMSGKGQFASIKTVVQQNAYNGMLGKDSSSPFWKSIVVSFYTPDGTLLCNSTQTNPPATCNALLPDGSAPLVEVAVTGFRANPFIITIVTKPGSFSDVLAPVTLSATSWDRVQAPPLFTGVPAL